MKATNPRDVAYIFRDYVRQIHAKCNPQDPSFLKISISCGHVSYSPSERYPTYLTYHLDRNVVRAQIPILHLRSITTRPGSGHRPQRPPLGRDRSRQETRQGAPRASEARKGRRREGQGYREARIENDEEGDALGPNLVHGLLHGRRVGVGLGGFVVRDP